MKNMSYYFLVIGMLAALGALSCSEDNRSTGNDNIENSIPTNSKIAYGDSVLLSGAKYPTVKIGNQVWLAKNVNIEAAYGSYCYNDSIENCNAFGRLYNWSVAKTVCPENWHIPSDNDWSELASFVGGAKTSAKKLMAKTGNWSFGGGTDDYGFSALPSGNRYYKGEYWNGTAYFWSANTETTNGIAYQCIWGVGGYQDEIKHIQASGEAWAYAVRCVKD